VCANPGMSAGRICVRTVQVADARESAREGARRMVRENVGTLVLLDRDHRPLGLVTDRDLMFHCVAEGRDAAATPLGEIMSAPPVTVREETPIEEALRRMAAGGVRRLLVVDTHGRLVGLLALDDVLALLAEETETIGRLLAGRPRTA